MGTKETAKWRAGLSPAFDLRDRLWRRLEDSVQGLQAASGFRLCSATEVSPPALQRPGLDQLASILTAPCLERAKRSQAGPKVEGPAHCFLGHGPLLVPLSLKQLLSLRQVPRVCYLEPPQETLAHDGRIHQLTQPRVENGLINMDAFLRFKD